MTKLTTRVVDCFRSDIYNVEFGLNQENSLVINTQTFRFPFKGKVVLIQPTFLLSSGTIFRQREFSFTTNEIKFPSVLSPDLPFL